MTLVDLITVRSSAMPGFMRIRVWDVAHGCCVMVQHVTEVGLNQVVGGRLAMIDSGSSADFEPSAYIKALGRNKLDYLFITNADQDHMSDLRGLQDAGIEVVTLIRNPSYTGEQMRRIKLMNGPLTDDANWYVNALGQFTATVDAPFNTSMAGITYAAFYNCFGSGVGEFTDTNNLSVAIFIKYNGFKMLFPGDLEKAGWATLLQRADFRAELAGTNVLMASHHGRESGYCEDIFRYFTPSCVVISDKPIMHAAQQMVPDYRQVIRANGVRVRTTMKDRHVLTTRRDGWIQFDVGDLEYFIDTEYHG